MAFTVAQTTSALTSEKASAEEDTVGDMTQVPSVSCDAPML